MKRNMIYVLCMLLAAKLLRQQGNQSGYIEEAACPLCDRYGEEGCRMGTQAVPSG